MATLFSPGFLEDLDAAGFGQADLAGADGAPTLDAEWSASTSFVPPVEFGSIGGGFVGFQESDKAADRAPPHAS